MQNGLHALATVVMHNEAKGVGKQLRTTLHRSAHVCAQGRFGERRDRIQKPCSRTDFLRAVNVLVAFERVPEQVAERAELLSRFLESSSYSFER